MGRRPRDPALHQAQGTWRADRHAEPGLTEQPLAEVPRPPSHLSATAKREWRRLAPVLVELSRLTESSLQHFASYCAAVGHAIEAEKAIKKFGALTNSPKLGVIKNPAFQILAASNKVIKDFLTEFGLTPASVGKVKSTPAREQDPLADLMKDADDPDH